MSETAGIGTGTTGAPTTDAASATTGTAGTRRGPVGVGIIGAGVISNQYLTSLGGFPDVDVLFIADLDLDRAHAQAELYGVPRSGTVDELLAQHDIEVVVNLTIPAVHAEVGHRILAAGKHVWSEKPFALDRESGRMLLEDAESRGLRVACAPDTFLGAGLQTTQRVIASGRIGAPVSALVLMQTAGPESWHPSPEFLFDVGAGPLFDIGPYYLTALVQNLGPVDRVTAVGSTARAVRTIGSGPKAGTEFPVNVPSRHSAILEFSSGATATVVFSFEAQMHRSVLEISGTDGSVELPDPNMFDGATIVYTWGAEEEDAESVPAAGATMGRGVGVLELARAIRTDVAERATGQFANHVLDVMVSIAQSASERRTVAVQSTAQQPELLPDGWDPTASTL